MKISSETLSILKNFASINRGIFIRPGNTLQVMVRAVLAEAIVAEQFPTEIPIYDLANLLSVINLFKDPEFDFGGEGLRIVEANGKAETSYGYAGDGILPTTVPPKLDPPPERIEFRLEEEQWSALQRACGVYSKPEVKILSDGAVVRMATENHADQHGNEYSTILEADAHGIVCKMIMSMDELKLIKGSYTGIVTPSYVRFNHDSGYNLTYYVGVEPTNSFFGEEE